MTATMDGQTLRVNYHDPIGLNLIAEEQTNVAVAPSTTASTL